MGKSTLLGALTKLERERGRSVAVLSIDPSSPFTKGALLGDRIRLTEHFLDPGVFIRSMANRGALGGLSEATLQAALLMDASGRDIVMLETVGVGQAEVDIIDHADTVVLVLMPGSGDSIQALKAGVMEIPDVIVVNKSDHPLTDTMIREIKGVLALGSHEGWQVPIVKTEAVRGEGVEELAEKLVRAPRVHRGRGNAVRAPSAQPDERGSGHRDVRMRRELEAAVREDADGPGAARPCRLARARPCERRHHASSSAHGGQSEPMREALTPPFLLAAGILVCGRRRPSCARPRRRHERCGRSGCPADRAMSARLPWPSSRSAPTARSRPRPVGALALASLYRVFAVMALLLARRQASCGCFGGARDSPASPAQSLLSGVARAARRAPAAMALPHSLGWVLARPAPTAAAARRRYPRRGLRGACSPTPSCPQAWGAWSAR